MGMKAGVKKRWLPCFGYETSYEVNRDTRELTMVINNTEDKENTVEEAEHSMATAASR